MYVALRSLKEQLASGKVVDLFPGDEVTTFDAWPYNNKVAAINARLVAQSSDGVPADAEALLRAGPNVQVRAQLAEEAGWARRDFAPVRLAAATPVPLAQPPVRKSVPAAVATGTVQDALVEDVGFACVDCTFVGQTAAGLRIHRGRSHKAE